MHGAVYRKCQTCLKCQNFSTTLDTWTQCVHTANGTLIIMSQSILQLETLDVYTECTVYSYHYACFVTLKVYLEYSNNIFIYNRKDDIQFCVNISKIKEKI